MVWRKIESLAHRVGALRKRAELCRAFLRVRGGAAESSDEPGTETVNDLDCMVANFWRALQHDPEAVADAADRPVNEADQHARHLWLCSQEEFRERMKTDPEFYDAKIAGWWVWGQCIWIGSGWCSVQLPHLGDAGRAERQLPHLGNAGTGYIVSYLTSGTRDGRKQPATAPRERGNGRTRKRPHLGNRRRGKLYLEF